MQFVSSPGSFLKQVRWIKPWKCLLLSVAAKWLKQTWICWRHLGAEQHSPGEGGHLWFHHSRSPGSRDWDMARANTFLLTLNETPQANASPEHISPHWVPCPGSVMSPRKDGVHNPLCSCKTSNPLFLSRGWLPHWSQAPHLLQELFKTFLDLCVSAFPKIFKYWRYRVNILWSQALLYIIWLPECAFHEISSFWSQSCHVNICRCFDITMKVAERHVTVTCISVTEAVCPLSCFLTKSPALQKNIRCARKVSIFPDNQGNRGL